ncbi:MAG TPA: glycosyltransferase family 39 protein [Isosphaeraceae bacterium]|nr:glycosyltransferase family 39 protein [Isosphaeraceae bacterium]
MGILLVAAALRFRHLGRLSLWYDEVVPMRLAREPSPMALLRLLFQIEATRAPLQPLVLHYWLRLWGVSDFSGRALSALCGVITVALVFRLGRRLYDAPTALWASWLAAISPLLIRYSQEAKMYAWLTMMTCLAWDRLLALRGLIREGEAPAEQSPGGSVALKGAISWGLLAAFAACQVALVYSHPLGLFMVAAQGLAFLACQTEYQVSLRRWLFAQGVVLLAIAPWVGHYLDHAPESTAGHLPFRFLLGLPIGFTGGNFLTLGGFCGLIAWGMIRARRRLEGNTFALTIDHPFAVVTLLLWFLAPPLMLYGYSLVAHPLFGPARYTLFVGPAYLLLLGRGLARLPKWASAGVGIGITVLATLTLQATVYAPDLKADWRSAASFLQKFSRPTVIVLSTDPDHNLEVETARYYLGRDVKVIGTAEAVNNPPGNPRDPYGFVIFAVGLKRGAPVAALPPRLKPLYEPKATVDFPGLRLEFFRRVRLD